jgi:hypothetical protein
MYECRACNFDLCVRCMKADLYISKFWTEKPWKHSKYGHTYKRKNPVDGSEVEEVEFIASAGQNVSAHTDNPEYYERRLENYSVLGKESLHLIKVCWMDPWACVEGIKKAKSISVYIYHAYGDDFNMPTTCDISLVDVKNHEGENIDTSKFTKVSSVKWPLEGWENKEKKVIVREKLADINVPENLQDKKLLCLV